MVTRQVELTEEQNETLETIAETRGKSVSELLRAGADEIIRILRLDDQEGQEPRQRAIQISGRFKSGLKDLSIEHDRYLDEAFGD
jgi:hypothetical protein